MLLFLHDERETSERCLVLFKPNSCSNSDLCSCREQFNRIDRWSTALDLAERDRWTECSWSDRLSCDRCPKTDVQNDAKETVWVLMHCHPDYQRSVSFEKLVNPLMNVHPALKACCLVTNERYVLIVPV